MKRVSLPFLMQSGGRTYFRRAGVLIRLPDPSADGFLEAYNEAKRGKPAKATRTSVSALIDHYRASSTFAEKSARTRAEYDKAMAYLREKIGARDVSWITTPRIAEMMQANHDKGRSTFANLLLSVVAVLCKHARLIGWRRDNPASDVPRVTVPAERKAPHLPWPDTVAALWRAEAKPMPLLAMEIGVGTMQRPDDWTRFRWSDYDGHELRLVQQKTGQELTIPCTPRLCAILDKQPKRGFAILTKRDGSAMSYRYMAQMMLKERKRLGTTDYDLHALRYLGVMELAWAGCTDDEIMSYSGHTTKEMVRKYAGKARQIMRARQANAKRTERDENKTRK